MPYIGNVLTSFAVETGNINDQAVTAPKLSATGGTDGQVLALDSNLNLEWVSDHAGQWVTSGSNIYYNDGNVGIGTSSPTDTNGYGTTLDIRGSGVGNGGVIYLRNSDATVTGQLAVYGDGRMDIGTVTNHPLKFYTFNSERLRIDSSGRLLVGTTTEGQSEADDLTIATAGHTGMTIRSGTTSKGSIYFSDGTSGNNEYRGVIEYDHSVDAFKLFTAATERLRVDISGNVGVNTSNPQAELHLNDATGLSRIRLSGGAVSADNFEFGQGTTGVTNGGFEIRDVDASATRFVIDSSGRLLIGTTTEGHISADNLTIADSGACGLTIRSGSTSGGSIYFSDATSGAGEYDGWIDYNQNSRYMRFGTAQAERLRIDSSGRLLISLSSSLLSYAGLQIKGDGDTGGHICLAHKTTTPVSGNNIGSVRYTNSAGGIGAIIGVEADANWTAGSSFPSRIIFATTADGASSPTERMRISNTGNIKLTGGEALFWDDAGDRYIACIGDTTSNINLHGRANVIFKTGGSSYDGGTERARVTSNGITFNGDTASANALDDYEEGSHTIVTNTNLTPRSDYSVWKYTKIGNQVTISGLLFVSSVSGSNNVSVSLPFAASGSVTNGVNAYTGQVMHNGVDVGDVGLAWYLAPGAATLAFYRLADNGSWGILNNSHLLANDEMYCTVTYLTA